MLEGVTKFLVFHVCFFSWITLYAQTEGFVYSNEINEKETVYILTNRQKTGGSENLKFQNNIKPEASLTFLKASYQKEDLLRVAEMDSVDFLSQISAIDGDWVLFIHGDGKTLESSIYRAIDIQHYHKVNVLVFCWPSRQPQIGGAKNFKNSRKNVIHSVDHFKAVLKFSETFKNQNKAFTKNNNFSLFIHSLGNYYLENYINSSSIIPFNDVLFDNLIINAAAVNEKNHHNWVEKLNFQKRIYITSNTQDFNLKGVRIFTKDGKQLGEKPKTPYAGNAWYINFTKAVGFRFPTGTTHTYFIGEIPEKYDHIKQIYSKMLHGNEIELTNSNLLVKRKKDPGYNMITNKRK